MQGVDELRHPIQPAGLDANGVLRFKRNGIVDFLLEAYQEKGGLNALSRLEFSRDDWEHFAQLIGYSVSGFSGLSYTRSETVRLAEEQAHSGDSALQVAARQSAELRARVKQNVRELVTLCFDVHPDYLPE